MSRLITAFVALAAILAAWLPARAGSTAPPPAPPAAVRAPAATFQFQYTTPTNGGACTGKSVSGAILDFPTARRAELEAAAATWGAVLASPVPIVVQACWASELYDPGAAGTGAPTTFVYSPSGAIFSNTFYPIALANARAGVDLAPGETDMVLTFLSTDVNITSIALHELGHGLGFEGNIDVSGGSSAHLAACSASIAPPWSSTENCPAPYDRLAIDGSGRLLLSYFLYLWDEGEPLINPADMYLVGNKLTVDSDAWLGGPNAMIQNGGSQVKLYTPPSWTNSSYSHVDSLPGNDALMQSSGGATGIGPITAGMMRDMGWPLTDSYHQVDVTGLSSVLTGAPVTLTASYSPTSASNPTSFTWSATDKSDVVHNNPGSKTDTQQFTWPTAGKKRVIVTASGSTGQIAGIFEVNVQSPATATPSPTATTTRTPTPGPTATPASRSLLPYVTRH